VVQGFLTLQFLPHLVRAAQPMIAGTRKFNRFRVDARGLSLASPIGLAALTGILLSAKRDNRFTAGFIMYPKKPHVRRYLSRMNFNRILGVRERRAAKPHRARRSGRFRELAEIATGEDCIRVTDQLRDVLKTQVPHIHETLLNNVAYCLSELLENVIHHAASPVNGVACAQAYKSSGAVELAIVDCGIGIRGSLLTRREYADQAGSDAVALQFALQKGVTSTPGRNSGEGLFFVAELLKKAGKMCLHSGDAVLTVNKKGVTVKAAPIWRGTIVGIRFAKGNVPIGPIFDAFVPPDRDEQLSSFEVAAPNKADG
jgi:anti-sigma regulatory factor (Ser/Thr protein kinase)